MTSSPRTFLMAAGFGTRLAPWTTVVPKPALPVAGEPVITHLLRLVARHGFRDVVTNASWLGELLEGMVGDGSTVGVRLRWSHEGEPLGNAGGMLHAEEHLRDGDAPILVLSGDGLHDVDLSAVVRAHRESGAEATMVVKPVADPSEFGVAVVDERGHVTGFQEKPALGTERSNLANTGIYVLQPSVVDAVRAQGFTDFGSELFPWMVETRREVGTVTLAPGAYWNDIGTLDEWRASNVAAVTGAVDLGAGPWDDVAETGVLVHPTADVDPTAVLDGPCIVGAGARVGAGTHLRSALVLPGGVVAEGQVIASGTVGTLEGLGAWALDLAASNAG